MLLLNAFVAFQSCAVLGLSLLISYGFIIFKHGLRLKESTLKCLARHVLFLNFDCLTPDAATFRGVNVEQRFLDQVYDKLLFPNWRQFSLIPLVFQLLITV